LPARAVKGSSLKVLAVDDEPDHLYMMEMYLGEIAQDFKIESVESPRAALEKIRKKAYDCVVLDYSMAEMPGLELAKKIREISQVPIIPYTGRGSDDIASQALESSVDDYIKKNPDPSHFESLAIRIRRTVDKHKLQDLAKAQFFPDVQVKLPEYPKVEVRGNYIYIVHEDGKEELWGRENRKSTALEASRDIELGLKAIKYGKDYLAKSLNDLMYDLMDQGIPVEYLDNIISQGYGDIKKLLKRLSESKSFPEVEK